MPSNMTNSNKDAVPKTRRKPGRVPTSCAECRRLKLRCDKNVPCEKCVSRGCGSICPDGSLTAGKGNRLILANTEELHDRIDTLCTRNRELEAALRIAQQLISDQPHPLLQKDVLQPITPHSATVIPNSNVTPPEVVVSTTSSEPAADHLRSSYTVTEADDENLVDAFGTLTLGARGQSSFHGSTARSEFLIRALDQQQPPTAPITRRLSKALIDASCSDICDPALIKEALSLLPPLSEAVRLCEIYQEYGKFLYTPIPRTELFDEILAGIYRVDPHAALSCLDSLALLFSTFAIGALFDPGREAYSVESQEYYYLARAMLRFGSRPSRNLIQAHIHVAHHLEFSDWDSTRSHTTWMYIGYAVRLAQSAGLHLDGARWNLSDSNVRQRSRLFYQLFCLDTWTSFHQGRQPTITPSYIDCPLPKQEEGKEGFNSPPVCFHTWNWQYTALLHSVMAKAFGPKQPTYNTILALDRQIRDFPVPEDWRPICRGAPIPTELCLQRWAILAAKETTLLNLHRAYFAKALQEMPSELMRHRYIPSVMSVYRSAWRLIKYLGGVWVDSSRVLSRLTLPWSQALSAAIVMCLIVTRAPTSNMASSALVELDCLYAFFKDVSSTSRSAENLLGSIQSLHKKAHDALDQPRGSAEGLPSNAELDRWSGKTHLLTEVGAPDSAHISGPPPPAAYTATSNEYWSDAQVDQMHPTLAQDMRGFNFREHLAEQFYDIPTTTLPQPPISGPIPDIHVGDPMFFNQVEYHAHQPQPQPRPQPHQAPFLQNAPILDATWQNFAEQLGF